MFSRTFFAYNHGPVPSFVSYPASDNNVVIRFFENSQWSGESFSLALKYQSCPKYDLWHKKHETGALN